MLPVATSEGTRRYRDRMQAGEAPVWFRAWPEESEEPLYLSTLGLGTYTGPADEEGDRQYAEAARLAVSAGINLIDCAINYRHMRSERAVGRALRAAFDAGEAARDEVVVMTKGGYLPFDGSVPGDVGSYFRATYLDPGILGSEDVVGGVHSITPRYLEDQLGRSLSNLGLEAVDVYFLHNVEQQLEGVAVEEFEKRVAAAFELLEGEHRAGRISLYGVSTWNGFRVPPDAPGHLSLQRLVEIAEEVGGEAHRFRVVQLPYNLGMPEALTTPTQLLMGKQMPFVEAASALRMITVTSVPLLQTQILPHIPANFAERMPGLHTSAQRAIQFVRSTPGVTAPLVGMRSAAHVRENAVVASVAPLTPEQFFGLFQG